MTPTPDIEAVRKALHSEKQRSVQMDVLYDGYRPQVDYRRGLDFALKALASLSSEPRGEKWVSEGRNVYAGHSSDDPDRLAAVASNSADAKQIASDHNVRLGLERAAREVISAWGGITDIAPAPSITALRRELDREGRR